MVRDARALGDVRDRTRPISPSLDAKPDGRVTIAEGIFLIDPPPDVHLVGSEYRCPVDISKHRLMILLCQPKGDVASGCSCIIHSRGRRGE